MAAGLGFKDFTTGEVLTAADVDGYLMQGIWVFASAAARDAAVTSPQEGNFAFLKDTNTTTYYTGSAWTNLDTTGMVNPMTTTGDTIYSSSGSTPARLGIGSTGQVLTVAGGVPSWATPASGGGLTLISETVASANSSINLTSIPGTYKQLLLVWSGLYPSGATSVFSIRFNNDSTAGIYEGMLTPISAPAGFSSDAADDGTNGGLFGYNSISNSSNYQQQVMGVLLIDNYASTSKYKFYNGNASWKQGSTNYVPKVNGVYKSTSAITSLDIVRLSGSDTLSNATNTSIRLYGLS